MYGPQFILYEDDLQRLNEICERLWRDAFATAIFLIDVSGQLVTAVGRTHHIDTTGLASLVAGSVAATDGLAQILGETRFPSHFHEGERINLYSVKVGEGMILALIFDERSSLGLVRLRLKGAVRELEAICVDIEQRMQSNHRPGNDPLSDITDEDIDRFFSDPF